MFIQYQNGIMQARIGQAKIPVLDLAGNYDRIAQVAQQRIGPELAAMGLSLTAFYVENISLPQQPFNRMLGLLEMDDEVLGQL